MAMKLACAAGAPADSFYSDEKNHINRFMSWVEAFFYPWMIQERRKRMSVMDQKDTSTKNSTAMQDMVVRSCELRLERHVRDANGTERVEFLCGASGGPECGYVLGVAGEDISTMIVICNSCSIPKALESQRACLTDVTLL